MSAAPDPLQIILLAFVFLVLAEILRALSAGTLLAPPQLRRQLQFDWAVLAASSLFISLNVLPVLAQPFLKRAATAVAKAAPETSTEKPAETATEKPAPTSLRVEAAVLTNFVIIAVLVLLIVARRKNELSDYGVDATGWLAEMRFGGLGFLACLPFVIALILLISPWRSPETQNPLLILLRQTGSERTIWEVVLAAVVSAPLAEELLFRVAFQGPLEARCRPATGDHLSGPRLCGRSRTLRCAAAVPLGDRAGLPLSLSAKLCRRRDGPRPIQRDLSDSGARPAGLLLMLA